MVIVEQGGDDHAGPEPGAILADPPPLSLETPGEGCHRQFGGRDAGNEIVRRVEDRKMPADDLVGPVALDPLCPGVPRRDQARQRPGKYGVIDDPIDQQPEPFFALAEGLVGVPALGDVAGELGEPTERWSSSNRAVMTTRPRTGSHPCGPATPRSRHSRRRSPPQLGRRDAGGEIVRRVEDRKMPADDLVRPVALDPLCPGVPHRDQALDVQAEYGVVDDTVDQKPELAIRKQNGGFAGSDRSLTREYRQLYPQAKEGLAAGGARWCDKRT